MAKKIGAETTAIIKAIENSTMIAKTIADNVAAELRVHTASDDRRFGELAELVSSVANDVKSLLDSRSFFRGAWWAAVGLASTVGAILAWVGHKVWNP